MHPENDLSIISIVIKQLYLIFCVIFFLSCHVFSFSGSGASSAYPFFQKQINEYSFKKDIFIDYRPTSSYDGIEQLINKTIHFAAVDMYLNDDLLNSLDSLIHIPINTNAISIVFNLHSIDSINLDSATISAIFREDIQYWDDPKIQTLNQTINLPHKRIVPIFRSGHSGSTYILSYFLNQTDLLWKQDIGVTSKLNLEFGLAANHSVDVSTLISQIDGSISYVGFGYSKNKLSTVAVKNKSGHFVIPNHESISAASDTSIATDTRSIITNTDSTIGYPISYFSWILVYNNQALSHASYSEAESFSSFLKWLVTDAQSFSESFNFSPLSKSLRAKALSIIDSLTYSRQSI